MQKWAEQFYKGRVWQKARDSVWARDKGLCQNCLKKGIVKTGDVVHHIKPLTKRTILDPQISLNPDNLITLCTDCHAEIHKKKYEKRYTIDELGRVIINGEI